MALTGGTSGGGGGGGGGVSQYLSDWTTFAFSTTITFVHGLGARPKGWHFELKCIQAVGDYIIGDIIQCSIEENFTVSNIDATDIQIITKSSSLFKYISADFFSLQTAQIDDWEFRLVAWS